jgi:hypothetical protein
MRGQQCVAAVLSLAFLAQEVRAGVARLSEETNKAFDSYIRDIDTRMENDAKAQHARVLDRVPDARTQALSGSVVAIPFARRSSDPDASIQIPGGLINHWFGAVFIPRAVVTDVRAVLQDYAYYSRIYGPDVAESRLVGRSGDDFDIFLRLHRQIHVKLAFGYNFPAEFNTNYRVTYAMAGDVLRVRSVSTRVAEVKDPKKSHTEEYPPGNDDGYLWRLNSYWRVYETKSPAPGVILECEVISLSRSVPSFLQNVVSYFTTNFPEDSMRATLDATRKGVQARLAQP